MSLARCSSLLIALSLIAPFAAAEEAAEPVISPEIMKLIQQLDADEFSDRASASEQLSKLGKDALPGLEDGVRSDSPEVASRSFELLQQLFEKGDGAAKVAAKSSLDKLAQGSDRVATQAKKLLEPKPPAVDPNQQQLGGVRILGGGLRIVGPRIARVMPIAPAVEEAVVRRAMTISTSVGPDGVRTINVDEDGKKFKVAVDPKKGIEGEYTETKDGKETTQKFAAKDADELKTKHPEAFKMYERYAKGDGAVRVEIHAALAARAAIAPAAARAVTIRPSKEMFAELLKKLEEQIAKSTKELEVAKAEKDPRVDVLSAVLESYARLRDRYQEQIKELESKEAEPPKKPEGPKEVEPKDFKIEIELR